MQTSFYEECRIVSSSGTILKTASDNTCVGPRRCENGQTSTDDLSHVGYDPFGNCTCPSKKTPSSNMNVKTETRVKRQTEEEYKTSGGRACRVERTTKGNRRKVCDEIVLVRQTKYTRANQIATLEAQTCEELKEDPSLCSILGFDCDDPGSLKDCF